MGEDYPLKWEFDGNENTKGSQQQLQQETTSTYFLYLYALLQLLECCCESEYEFLLA